MEVSFSFSGENDKIKRIMTINISKEKLYKLYWKEEYSLAEIENKLNIVRSTLIRTFKKLEIKTRTTKEASNTKRYKREHIIRNTERNHPNWKGGICQDVDGYMLIKKRNHPRANSRGYVRRSHLVAEKKLGRYLERNEVVHHKNGNIADNRIEIVTVPEKARVYLDSGFKGQSPVVIDDLRSGTYRIR